MLKGGVDNNINGKQTTIPINIKNHTCDILLFLMKILCNLNNMFIIVTENYALRLKLFF